MTKSKNTARGREIAEGRRFQKYAGPRRKMEALWQLISAPPIPPSAPVRQIVVKRYTAAGEELVGLRQVICVPVLELRA